MSRHKELQLLIQNGDVQIHRPAAHTWTLIRNKKGLNIFILMTLSYMAAVRLLY